MWLWITEVRSERGLQRVFPWPLGDEARQLELVAETLMPALSVSAG